MLSRERYAVTITRIAYDLLKCSVFFSATSVRICIQGNKDNTDFQFRFDDGSQMNYFLWDIGQPANKNDEHYLIMTKRENANLYQWNDVFKLRLDLQCLVICEK